MFTNVVVSHSPYNEPNLKNLKAIKSSFHLSIEFRRFIVLI